MNKPFSKALRDIPLGPASPVRGEVASDVDQAMEPGQLAEPAHGVGPVDSSQGSKAAYDGGAVPGGAPIQEESNEDPFSNSVRRSFQASSAGESIERTDSVDPMSVADIGVPHAGLPNGDIDFVDTTDQLAADFAHETTLRSQRESETESINRTPSTATGAIIAKIMERKMQATDLVASSHSSKEFLARIQDLPPAEEARVGPKHTPGETSTQVADRPISGSPNDMATKDEEPPPSDLGDDAVVCEDEQQVRASQERAAIVPAGDEVAIRPNDLMSHQDIFAEPAPETPVVQVTAMPVTAVEVPVSEHYARNPPPPTKPSMDQEALKPFAENRPDEAQPSGGADPQAETADTDTDEQEEVAAQADVEGPPPQSLPSQRNVPQSTNDDHVWLDVEDNKFFERASTPAQPEIASRLESIEKDFTDVDVSDVEAKADEASDLNVIPTFERPVASSQPLLPKPPPDSPSKQILPTDFEASIEEYLNTAGLMDQFRLLAETISQHRDPVSAMTIALAHVDELDFTHEVIAALANVFSSKHGTDALIVDADVTQRKLSRHFSLEREEGFGEACDHNQLWPHLVKPTSVPGVFVLPAGTCADQNLLRLERARRLFAEFSKGSYGVVLVYSGDVSYVHAKSLCQAADTAYVIVRLGKTDRKDAQTRIKQSGIHFSGCLVTNATQHAVYDD